MTRKTKRKIKHEAFFRYKKKPRRENTSTLQRHCPWCWKFRLSLDSALERGLCVSVIPPWQHISLSALWLCSLFPFLWIHLAQASIVGGMNVKDRALFISQGLLCCWRSRMSSTSALMFICCYATFTICAEETSSSNLMASGTYDRLFEGTRTNRARGRVAIDNAVTHSCLESSFFTF